MCKKLLEGEVACPSLKSSLAIKKSLIYKLPCRQTQQRVCVRKLQKFCKYSFMLFNFSLSSSAAGSPPTCKFSIIAIFKKDFDLTNNFCGINLRWNSTQQRSKVSYDHSQVLVRLWTVEMRGPFPKISILPWSSQTFRLLLCIFLLKLTVFLFFKPVLILISQ